MRAQKRFLQPGLRQAAGGRDPPAGCNCPQPGRQQQGFEQVPRPDHRPVRKVGPLTDGAKKSLFSQLTNGEIDAIIQPVKRLPGRLHADVVELADTLL